MGRALQNLYDDHDHILVALDAIDRALWHAAQGQRSLEFFEAALEFIVVFADGAHYDKEELLFAAVLAHPMPPAAVPVGCLNMEHDATRAQAGRMREALAAIRAGNAAEWFTVMDAFARYSAIIRVHVPKENSGFFPMSDSLLGEAVQTELLVKFEAIDRALPSTIQAAAAALSQKAGAITPAPPPRVERNHTDKYTLYDDRLASALAALGVDYRQY